MTNNWNKYETLVLSKLNQLEKNHTENKIDIKTVSARLSNIEKSQIENAADLHNHIRRTNLNEERIIQVENKLEKEVNNLEKSIHSMHIELKNDLNETRKVVQGWKANLTLLGWLFSAVAIILGIILKFYII
jgi:pectate lyase